MNGIIGLLVCALIAWGVFDIGGSFLRYSNQGQAIVQIQPGQRGQETQPSFGSADPTAITAAKSVEEKIRAAAPLFQAALAECSKPIPASLLIGIWGRESTFCMGQPYKPCGVSTAKAVGPMQHKASDKTGQFAHIKPGENPEQLGSALNMTVRHLCEAKRADKGHEGEDIPNPASDMAIMRYHGESSYANPSGYLKDVRAIQAAYEPIWASLASGHSTETVIATTTETQGPHMANVPINVQLFPAKPIDGFLDWFSAWGNQRSRDDGARVTSHLGVDFGKHGAVPVRSVCAGEVTFAGLMKDGPNGTSLAGNTVMVVCGDDRTSHMHLASIQVRVGQRVGAGEQVGVNGQSGNAAGGKSGPHDHFKLEHLFAKNDWRAVNPCAPGIGLTAVRCAEMFGPNTYFAPLKPLEELAMNR